MVRVSLKIYIYIYIPGYTVKPPRIFKNTVIIFGHTAWQYFEVPTYTIASNTQGRGHQIE